MREYARFCVQQIAVMRVHRDREPLGTPARADALAEPGAVPAVARPEDVPTLDPFVRLHEVGPVARERRTHGACEARVAPDAADVERIADDGRDAPGAFSRPFARVDADLHATLRERVDRALDEPLRSAEGRVTLAPDAEPHRGAAAVSARSSVTAATTGASGNVSRQSELLLPPQPLRWHGRHVNM